MAGTGDIVLDTTVISNFARSDSIDELCTVIEGSVKVPKAVIVEVQKGVEDGYEFLRRAQEVMPPASKSSSSQSYEIVKPRAMPREHHQNNRIEHEVSEFQLSAKVHRDSNPNVERAREFLSRILQELDWGEASALQIGYVQNTPVATDDRDARELAREFGVDVTGSLGILARCVRRDVIDERTANSWLSIWINENDYYSPITDISQVI